MMMYGYDMGYGGGGFEDPFLMDSGHGFTGILSFMNSWPDWAVTLMTIAAIIIGGYILGKIIGSIYASIKYPDPDKPQIFTSKQKIGFLCIAVLVSGLIYFALKPPVEELPEDMMGEMGEMGDYGVMGEDPMVGDYGKDNPIVATVG